MDLFVAIFVTGNDWALLSGHHGLGIPVGWAELALPFAHRALMRLLFRQFCPLLLPAAPVASSFVWSDVFVVVALDPSKRNF